MTGGTAPATPIFVTGYPEGSAPIARRSTLYHVIIRELFARARQSDEFEYACALLNFDGMKDAGWSPEVESAVLVSELKRFVQLPMAGHTQVRLLLLAYSHIAEMDITYQLVMNMLRVVVGDRYSMLPFVDKRGERIDKPSDKVAQIAALAAKVGLTDVPALFDWYEPRLRNSFAHSNYHLHEGRYNIVRGKGIVAEGLLESSLSIERELVPRFNGALRFFDELYAARNATRLAYRENVVVRGRLQSDDYLIEIELLADPDHGLTGFRGPPQS